jgi:uncharacterized protein (TIGR03084 family)
MPDLRLAIDERAHREGYERRRARAPEQMVADLGTMTSELYDELDGLTAEQSVVASLCPGWTVHDVVVHFAVGDEMARKVLEGDDPFAEMSDDDSVLDARAASLAAAFGEVTTAEATQRFRAVRDELLARAASIEPANWSDFVPWAARPITRFALVQSRLMETWVHGWDLRWPLSIPQVLDDRAWWVADIAVRHAPYGLRKQQLPLPKATARFDLSGPGGGSWTRDLVADPVETISVSGPSWAWITWASRRHPGKSSRDALTVTPNRGGEDVLASARCYA